MFRREAMATPIGNSRRPDWLQSDEFPPSFWKRGGGRGTVFLDQEAPAFQNVVPEPDFPHREGHHVHLGPESTRELSQPNAVLLDTDIDQSGDQVMLSGVECVELGDEIHGC